MRVVAIYLCSSINSRVQLTAHTYDFIADLWQAVITDLAEYTIWWHIGSVYQLQIHRSFVPGVTRYCSPYMFSFMCRTTWAITGPFMSSPFTPCGFKVERHLDHSPCRSIRSMCWCGALWQGYLCPSTLRENHMIDFRGRVWCVGELQVAYTSGSHARDRCLAP